MLGNTVQLGINIVSDASGAAAGLQQTSGMFGRISVGAVAVAGAVLGVGVAAGKMAYDAVGAAGDLEQSIGAVDTVFKGSAGQIHDWATSAAQDVGLARNEYNELGTLIGTQLKNGGTAMDQLAPKTNELIGLGADLSSMFGGDTKDAVAALSSALKGERDPIERYGVSLNQARIDAKAAELGFKKVDGALSAEANQAATLALIMDQTADAHGNFAKEGDTLQGKQQRFNAAMANTQAIIGTALLPIVTALFGVFNDQLAPILGDLATAFGAWMGGLDLAGWWAGLTGSVTGAGDALAGIQGIISAIVGWFTSRLQPALDGLAGAFVARFAAILAIGQELAAGLWARLEPLLPQIGGIFARIGETIVGAVQIITIVWNGLTDALMWAWDIAGPYLIDIIATTWTAIIGVIQPAIDLVAAIIGTVLAALQGDWATAWTGCQDILTAAWDLIVAVVTGAVDIVASVIGAALGIISGVWESAWAAISGALAPIWASITTAVSDGITDVLGWFAGLPGRILGALGDLGSLLVGAGRAIIDGLLAGLRASWGKVTDFVGGIADWIAANKGPLSYDAGLLVPAGLAIMGGLVAGLRSQRPALGRELDAITNQIADTSATIAAPTIPAPTLTPAPTPSADNDNTGRQVHIHVDGAFVGDEVALAREVERLLAQLRAVEGAPA